MMSALRESLLALSSSPAASLVVKATLIMVMGLVATGIARESRAAVRHALLAAMFAGLLVLPIAAIFAPAVPIAIRDTTPVVAHVAAERDLVLPLPAATRPAALAAPPRSEGITIRRVLFAVWFGGFAILLFRLVTGLGQVRRLHRSALPWRHGQSAAYGLALEAGVFRQVDVLFAESVAGPLTCGAWRPAIVLPMDAENWPEADLTRALVHELEHIRRWDWLSQCLARTVCALYWFHPMAWMAWRRFGLEAERSCDDAVLERSEATAYADQLVELARRLAGAKPPVLAMASRADLSRRVGAVLDGAQRRGRAGVVPVAMSGFVAAMLVFAISPVKIVAAATTAAQPISQARPISDAAAPSQPISNTRTSILPLRIAAVQATPTPRPPAAISPVPQYRTKVSLVQVPVIVTDTRGGRPITNLTADDFTLLEDGVPQHIVRFELRQPTDDAASSYYVLGYYPRKESASEDYRRITVRLVNPAAPPMALEYRQGYWTSKPLGQAPDTVQSNPTPASSDIQLPVPVYKREPEYSDEARKARYQGSVTLLVEIDGSGNVMPGSIRVTRSLGLGLDEKAIQAVSEWRFKPGMKGGNPTAMQVEVTVDFRLL